MNNLQLEIAGKEIEIYHVSAMTAGYGHKRIEVELLYEGNSKKFAATTDNMPSYDAATDLEGAEKYRALYDLVEYKIEDQIVEWIEEI